MNTAAKKPEPATAPIAAQSPLAGGQYVREADGSLRQVGATQPAQGRAVRASANPLSTTPTE